MRTKSHELQSWLFFLLGFRIGIDLVVNQHEVRLDMAVAVVHPITGAPMVAAALRKRLVGHQQVEDVPQLGLDRLAILSLLLAFVIGLEGGAAVNLPRGPVSR